MLPEALPGRNLRYAWQRGTARRESSGFSLMPLLRRSRFAVPALAVVSIAVGVRAEGLAVGPWQAAEGVYRSTSSSRALYYLTDQPYMAREGVLEAAVTVRERVAKGGWGAAALLLSTDPQSFWTLSLVEGPDGHRYCEFIELYQGIHQAQSTGTTRLVPIEATVGGEWRYGQAYRLRIALTPDRIVGEITPEGSDRPLARLGWLLAGATALREGWAALRSEQFDSEFTQVKVTAPARPSATVAVAPAYPQGPRGCAGLYFGAGLPGAESAPDTAVLERALRRAGFEVVPLAAADLAAPGALDATRLRCLVGDWRRVPAGAVPELLRWLRQGGLLVSVTAPAFGEFFWPVGDRWLPWSDYSQHGLGDLGKQARPIVSWAPEELAAWQPSQGGHAAVVHRVVVLPGAAPEAQPALHIEVPAFATGWWSLGRRFDAPPAADDEAVTCFWARADEGTPELSLEWAEVDGSRWVATVTLSRDWRCYALAPQAFGYWTDNPSKGRGRAGDSLRLAQAVRLQVALSQTHTAATLMADTVEHHVWLGPLGLAVATPETLAALVPADRPEMEALSPGYKLFTLPPATTWQATPAGRRWGIPAALPAVPALAAIERPGGEGMDRGHWWRWVPLATARVGDGTLLGAPMSLVLNEVLPLPRCAWMSLGLRSLADFAKPEFQETVAAAVARVKGGPLLFEAGARHFLWRPGEDIAVGARVVNHTTAPANATAIFRLARDGSPAAPTLHLPVSIDPHGLSDVRARLGPLSEGQYVLATVLVVGDAMVDRIEHPLTIVAAPTAPPPAESVVCRDAGGSPANPGRFTLGGKPWHPVGTNYWPHFLGGIPTSAYWSGWLDPSLYVPHVAEADLAQMQSWGFTAIAGVGADVHWDAGGDNQTLRNLEDFMWRCHRHGVKLFLFCAGLDPRGRDDAAARRLIEAVRYHPALAAYDIAWEPGYYEARHGYAAQWRDWLGEHYGSLEAAEKALGHPLPRTPQGEVTVPPDAWCDQPGPWEPVAAVYRAYMDWQLGAEYRRSARLVRDLDPLHLVGFRGSNVTSPLNFKPVEQPSVLHFMDWAGPEGYDVPAYGRLTPAAEVAAKGLCTRILSYLSGGKPLIWMEFGMPVYPNGTTWRDSLVEVAPARLEYQVEEGRRWWQMMVDSGAWGCFQWWYPGGFRVGENSDCGLVTPANRPRPVAAMAQQFVPAFAASETYGAEGVKVLDGRPEDGPGGWIGLYLRCRDKHGVAEISVPSLDSASPAALQTDPAGRPWPGTGPLRYLNAIFERLRLRAGEGPWQELEPPTVPGPVEVALPAGGPLELEAWVGNTAEAVWLPAGAAPDTGCRLAVTGDLGASLPLPVAVGFQGSAHLGPARVAERFTAPLRFRLQMQAAGRVSFGEVVRVTVAPRTP
jgi:SAM-dependent methyltransferase